MSEVEKMYRNSGIEKCNRLLELCPFGNECDYCEHNWYPEFTAEKQLKIIVFLVNKGYNVTFANLSHKFSLEQISKSLALCINSKWNNLTEQERTEIAEILRG